MPSCLYSKRLYCLYLSQNQEKNIHHQGFQIGLTVSSPFTVLKAFQLILTQSKPGPAKL